MWADRAVTSNIAWLFSDRLMRMAVGLLVGAWVARYLGPERYGELAYAIAFVAMLQVVARLGLDTILLRDIPRSPALAGALLGTSLRLQFGAGIVAAAAGCLIMKAVRPDDPDAWMIVAILGAGLLFQTSDIVDVWFQSITQSRRSVLARFTGVLTAGAVRVGLILTGCGLMAFAWATLIETMIVALALAIAYGRQPAPSAWFWDRMRAASLVREAAPFLISGVAIIVYMRIDQIMLREIAGVRELGIYSAAIPLSTAWNFAALIIGSSLGPSIARARTRAEDEFRTAMRHLFSIMWWLSVPFAVAMAVAAAPLVGLLYGPDYAPAAAVLAVHAFGNIPVAVGIAQQHWFVNQGLGGQILVRTLVGLLANVVLNGWLIPSLGALGAAIASVLSFSVSAVLCNVLLSPPLALLQFEALIRPNFKSVEHP